MKNLLLIFAAISLVSISETLAFSFSFLPQDSSSPELQSPPSATTLITPILTNLGFQELALAVPTLSIPLMSPITIFAPTDDSIRSCPTCSTHLLLREHIVPGSFPLSYLSQLAFSTKIPTLNPDHCITLTSTVDRVSNATKIFVSGVEITNPDMFNNGQIVVHGLQGFVGPIANSSCVVVDEIGDDGSAEHGCSAGNHGCGDRPSADPDSSISPMLRDAMLRLRASGYSVLALALRVKYQELVELWNMTVFVLDDASIFSGGHSYVSNVRFHIVPNRLMAHADLVGLPVGATLQTLVRGQELEVTRAGPAVRINYVPIKAPNAMQNTRIIVHGIYLPFPHLKATPAGAAAYDGIFHPSETAAGSCLAAELDDAMAPARRTGKMPREDWL